MKEESLPNPLLMPGKRFSETIYLIRDYRTKTKAAEGRRTPRRWREIFRSMTREASWSAPVLWRFRRRDFHVIAEIQNTYPHFSVFICALGAPSSKTTPSANSTRVVGPQA